MEGEILEKHQRDWFIIHSAVPGAEVHQDPDVIWKIENGPVWSNAATGVRFKPGDVERRLDEIIGRFAKHGRGGAFWIDLNATPIDLEHRLKKRGFRCRKHFPGMSCQLSTLPEIPIPTALEILLERDYSAYSVSPHPVWGRINTAIRRYQMQRIQNLASLHPDRVFHFVATRDKRSVGACTLFLGGGAAGIHDLAVIKEERGKGIGSALTAHVLEFAKDRGHQRAVLLASGMGETMYQRVGFREVCRIGYWYRASFGEVSARRRTGA